MNRTLLLVLGALLAGCDDYLWPSGHGGGPIEGEGWCAVRDLFAAECTACHGGAALGGLDLEADPTVSLIGVESANYAGSILVDPGSPSTSLLYLKVTDAQGSLGTEMPPSSGGIDPAVAGLMEAWILDGAPTVCEGEVPQGYHPSGYGQPLVHGQEAKLQIQDCTECHGEALEGGPDGALTCASECHGGGTEWVQNCQWCHGSDESGLPPEDIDDSSPTDISFPGHGAHVSGSIAPVYDCVQCHQKPTDVFSDGHLFVGDSTPAVAEVRFELGTFPGGSYSSGTCSVYCHSSGVVPRPVSRTDARAGSCTFCHGGAPTGIGLSAPHDSHVGEGLACEECHGLTASGSTQIVDTSLHVNGTLDLQLPVGMSQVGGLCTGTCHGELHQAVPWLDD